ncbi:MAG: type IV pilus modification protein PilV [Proteobacteria bacterium]|nr:type IV pilus modification protein PilV [Pseudomonadota bacterium]
MSLRSAIRRRARGFSLIEVLMALLVFSLGILGLVALQAKAVTYSIDAEDRTRAALLVDDLVSTMWAQQSATVASDTLSSWATRLGDTTQFGLPGSPTYSITTTSGLTTITVTWAEPTRLNAAGAAASSSYSTTVAIP